MTTVHPASNATFATRAEKSASWLCISTYACSLAGKPGRPSGRARSRSVIMHTASHHIENDEHGVPIHTTVYSLAAIAAKMAVYTDTSSS